MRKLLFGLFCCSILTIGSCIKNDSPNNNTGPGPSILNISVPNGIVGDTITINGSNFSTNPANNTVQFNGTAAEVISSSASSISVVVPAGASTGNITVSVNGLVSSNIEPFTVLPANVYSIGDGSMGQPFGVGVYFRNGTLTGIVSKSTGIVTLTGIYVSGQDIYVCGIIDVNGITAAAYWKNGIETDLTNGTKAAGAWSIWVSGSDVYVAGGDNNGIEYWKNGNMVTVPVTGTFTQGSTYSVFVSGTDVYIAGTYIDGSSNQISAYWKNGVQVNLTGNASSVNQIIVSGNDVYVAGQTYNNTTQNHAAAYWKNGIRVDLSDGTADIVTSGIYVNGIDVYISGYQYGTTNANPFYWLNGSKIELTPGPGSSYGIAGSGNNIYIGCSGVVSPGGISFGFWFNNTFQSMVIPSTLQLSQISGVFVQAP